VFAPFLEFFGAVGIFPKHIAAPVIRDKKFNAFYSLDTPPNRIVGCGPFRVKAVQKGKSILFERNPEYWVADKQGRRLPYLGEVEFVLSGAAGSEALMFVNGKGDLCDVVPSAQYDLFQQAAAAGSCALLPLGVGVERDFFWFNQNTNRNSLGAPLVDPVTLKWFRNKKFRQAVSHAIDREHIAREAYKGRASAMYGFVSAENKKWYNGNLPRYDYDPGKATGLLAELGIKPGDDGIARDADGNKLEIQFCSNANNPLRAKAAEMIVNDLKAVGIRLVYTPLDFQALRLKVDSTFEYEAALMGLGGGGTDPCSQMNVLKSNDELHQWFPMQKVPSSEWEARIDQLMDMQLHTIDYATRKKAYDEVQAILADELPMIQTIAPLAYSAARSHVKNLKPTTLTPYRLTWNIEELWLETNRPSIK
jgi:peptide/nickel transport system substrate-binding protein